MKLRDVETGQKVLYKDAILIAVAGQGIEADCNFIIIDAVKESALEDLMGRVINLSCCGDAFCESYERSLL